MTRCKLLPLALLLVFSSAISDVGSNIFLSGEYKNSIDSHPITSEFENSINRNIFLEHAIFSRQAAPFSAPTYLPPTQYIKCGGSQQCVKQNVCVGGYFTNNPNGYIANCQPETDVCCTYRAPPTTTTTTQRPYVPCGGDSDCVAPSQCSRGTINVSNYAKKSSSNRCYAPEVCCRLPATALTPDGYVLTVPEIPFPQPQLPKYNPPVQKPAYIPPAPPAPPVYRPQAPPSPPAPPAPPAPPVYVPPQRPQYIPPAPPAPPVYQPPKPQPPKYIPPAPPAPPVRPVYRPSTPYTPPYSPPTYIPPAPPRVQPPAPPRVQPPAPPRVQPPAPPRVQPPAPPQYQPPTPPKYQPPTPPKYQPPTPPKYQPPAPPQYQPPAPPRIQPPSPPRVQPPSPPRVQPPPRPQIPQKPIKEYLPPVPRQPQVPRLPQQPLNPIGSPSIQVPVRGEDILSEPIFPTRKPVFSNNLSPFAPQKCSAALICTDVNFCDSLGVISDSPTNLTPQQAAFRVPIVDCAIEGTGAPGKCCRDSNYVDPWPANPRGQCSARNSNTKPRGVTEEDTSFAEIPWQAMVLKESTKSLLCGGAIIGYGMVLTSASCLSGVPTKDILVKAGEWQLGTDDEPLPFQLVRALEVEVHPNYDPASGQNNLAIILLEKNLQSAIHVGPICISDKDPSPSERCIVTGWGKDALRIHEQGALMHQTPAQAVPRSECGASQSQVCAKTTYDACHVDYGSALACGTGTSYVLKGTFTNEDQCGDSVASFTKPDIKWINTAFNNNNRALLLG